MMPAVGMPMTWWPNAEQARAESVAEIADKIGEAKTALAKMRKQTVRPIRPIDAKVAREQRADVLNYGGGFQTVAMCVMVAEGILPRPDRIVMADTGREVRSTFDYLRDHMQPYLERFGMQVEVAPHGLAKVDLYSHKGLLLLPVYTETGKFQTYCSSEWKRDVIRRYLRSQGITSAVNWIGFAFDERRRWNKGADQDGPWPRRFPLVELMVRKADCPVIIRRAGLPEPHKSRCKMCPHQSNEEWRELSPDEFEDACRLDEQIREEDEQGALFLHHSRVPLREADLDADDRKEPDRQCGLGLCMI